MVAAAGRIQQADIIIVILCWPAQNLSALTQRPAFYIIKDTTPLRTVDPRPVPPGMW